MGDTDDLKTRFEAISRGAILDVLLPNPSDLDAAAILKDGSLETIRNAPSRRNLFFDEEADITLVLKVASSEQDIRQLLPSLEILLAAHATDAVPQGTGNVASASGKHDLTSKIIQAAVEDDLVVVGQFVFIVWKSSLHLTRPRVRLQRPAIYFTANLTVSAAALGASHKPQKAPLTAFEPLPPNVLAPLHYTPEFSETNIYLPEDRITKVAPKPPKKDDTVKSIRGVSKRAFPTLPALFTRIRYTHLSDSVIASLHLDASQVIAGTFAVERLELTVPDPDARFRYIAAADQAAREGRDAPLESDFPDRRVLRPMTDTAWPLHLRAGDESVLLYKIDMDACHAAGAGQLIISVVVDASVTLEQDLKIQLDIAWQSQVDLTAVKSTGPPYKWSRPLSGTSSHQLRLSTVSSHRSASSDGADKPPLPTDKGLTFSFTAPATTYQGNDFMLKVKCVNESGRPRRFTIVSVQPKPPPPLLHRKRPSVDKKDNADFVTRIVNTPTLGVQKEADVQCVTPDVRIGPLPPGTCYETHIALRALRTGVLSLGMVRIVDLDARRTVDVIDLPEVVALEAIAGATPYRLKQRIILEADPHKAEWEDFLEKNRKDMAEAIAREGDMHEAGQEQPER